MEFTFTCGIYFFTQPIEILEKGGVISQKVALFSKKVTEIMLQELEHPEQDKMEMFITHLAMAGKRMEEGTEENPMDEDLLESIKEEPDYEKAFKLLERLLGETDLRFSKTEQDFLSVHICNLLS